jgi:hypothetical protein
MVKKWYFKGEFLVFYFKYTIKVLTYPKFHTLSKSELNYTIS